MITLLTTIFFVFGLIIGSFLNMVIFRMNTERSFGGRSACLSCKHQLSWYELIPVASYLLLLGRCRNCKTKISAQYPIIELCTGLLFALLFLKFQNIFFSDVKFFTYEYAYYSAAFSLLLVIAGYDLRHKIIPDALAFILGLLTFIGLFLFTDLAFHPHIPTILEFASGLVISVPFFLFWLVSGGKWMGLGDAKLAIGLGWLLGTSIVLSGAVIAFWIGAIVGIVLIIFSKKHGIKSEIPFAPYLVLGALIAFLSSIHLFF